MKNIFLSILFMALMASPLYAANVTIGDLTADTTPALTDLLETEDDPGGTPVSKKSTIGQVLSASPDMNSSGEVTGGDVDTAVALASDPNDCAANEFADSIVASGNLGCNAIVDADVPNDITIDLATVATTATITDNESTDEENPLVFVAGADPDGGNLGLETDGDCTYNPSNGEITCTGFVGALTGNADTATNLSTLIVGTLTDENVCEYEATGTFLICDTPKDGTGACAAGSICTGGHTHAGGGGSTTFPLFPYSGKLTGSYVTATITNLDAAVSAGIDAGDGNWRALFDASTDEAMVFYGILPSNYSSVPVCNLIYSLTSATTLEVEWECAIQCTTPGDAEDIGTETFAAGATTGGLTVPGTAGHTDTLATITPTDDSCAAGDLIYYYISTDANDATNDDATGDRELVGLYGSFTE